MTGLKHLGGGQVIKIFTDGFGMLVYFGMGLVQLAAIFTGIDEVLGVGWFLSAVIGLCVTYIPLIGTIGGLWGAMEGWGWSFWEAGILFFGPWIMVLIIGGIVAMSDRR